MLYGNSMPVYPCLYWNQQICLKFSVQRCRLKVVSNFIVKITVIWDVMPCDLIEAYLPASSGLSLQP
jgi:hypothetical protein